MVAPIKPLIPGTNVSAKVVPYTTFDNYPTHDSKFGIGGWRECASIGERDDIPAERLRAGMIAYVVGDQPYLYTGSAWVTLLTVVSSTPGGANTQIQFNNAGIFAGDSNFTWDNTLKQISAGPLVPTAFGSFISRTNVPRVQIATTGFTGGESTLGGTSASVIAVVNNLSQYSAPSGLNQFSSITGYVVWTPGASHYVLTSVDNYITIGGIYGTSTLYHGTFPNGANNGLAGVFFTVAGFTNSNNNANFCICLASTATTLTLGQVTGVAETHAAVADNVTGTTVNAGIFDVATPSTETGDWSQGTRINPLECVITHQANNHTSELLSIYSGIGCNAGNGNSQTVDLIRGLYLECLLGDTFGTSNYTIGRIEGLHIGTHGWQNFGTAGGTIGNSWGIDIEGPRLGSGTGSIGNRAAIRMASQIQGNPGGRNPNAWGIVEEDGGERNAFGSIYLGGGGSLGSGATNTPLISTGNGSPEGVVTAVVASLYLQKNATLSSGLWTKVSGSGNTGWTSVGTTPNIVTKVANYTATFSDYTINGNGTFTITLPTTNIKIGQLYQIKNIGVGVITISCSVNIDNATTLSLPAQYQSVTVQWDGSQYWIY